MFWTYMWGKVRHSTVGNISGTKPNLDKENKIYSCYLEVSTVARDSSMYGRYFNVANPLSPHITVRSYRYLYSHN